MQNVWKSATSFLLCLAWPALSTGTEPAPEIAIRNARTPAPGILTGGQPTPEQLKQVAAAGYRTVVNLRGTGEGDGGEGEGWDEAAAARDLGLDYVAIPIASAADLTEENARLLAEVLDDPERRPVLVHCASGNRVGALFALEAFVVDGKDGETALQIGLDAGLTSLREVVEKRLLTPGDD